MKLEVGSIVYIIDPNKRTVVPAQVQEQLVSRTMQGEKVTHNVETPSGNVTCLESLNSTFFKSLEEVRQHLMSKAEEVIDAGIKNAARITSEKFQDTQLSENPLPISEMASAESMSVTLEDGTKANIKFPSELLGENISS